MANPEARIEEDGTGTDYIQGDSIHSPQPLTYRRVPGRLASNITRRVQDYGPDARRYITYSFGTGFGLGFLQVLLGLYVLSLGYGESFLATQEVVIALCSAAASLAAGVVIDRFGTRAALLASALFTICGRFLIVSYPSRIMMLAAAAVIGVGVAFFWVSQSVVLAQVSTKEQRPGLFGLNWALLSGSGFVGGAMAGALPGVLGPALGAAGDSAPAYRYTVWVGVALLVLASLPLLRMPKGKAVGQAGGHNSGWKIDAPRRTLRPLIAVTASAVALGFTVPFLSVFLSRTFQAPTSSIGLTLGVFALTGSLGGLLSPLIRRRYGAVRAVSTLLVLSAPLMLLAGYAPGFAVASLALWVRGLTTNAAWPVVLAHLMENAPESQRGRVNAVMNMSFELSLAAATLPAGIIMQYVDYWLPHALGAAALLAGGLGFAYASRRPARSPAPTS